VQSCCADSQAVRDLAWSEIFFETPPERSSILSRLRESQRSTGNHLTRHASGEDDSDAIGALQPALLRALQPALGLDSGRRALLHRLKTRLAALR
jgi:hypothetical protein